MNIPDTTVPPAPRLVKLTHAKWEELVVTMSANRTVDQAPETPAIPGNPAAARPARNKLVVALLPWIESRVRAFTPNVPTQSDRFQDRLTEAQARVIEAMDGYDVATGVPLTAWIEKRHAIDAEEVRDASELPTPTTRAERRSARRGEKAVVGFVYLDAPTSGDDGLNQHDLIASRSAKVEDEIDRLEREEAVHLVLRALPIKQAEVLSEYYGINRPAGKTFARIAQDRGITEAAAHGLYTRATASAAALLGSQRNGGSAAFTHPPEVANVRTALTRLHRNFPQS